jgi:hypothetical protein
MPGRLDFNLVPRGVRGTDLLIGSARDGDRLVAGGVTFGESSSGERRASNRPAPGALPAGRSVAPATVLRRAPCTLGDGELWP